MEDINEQIKILELENTVHRVNSRLNIAKEKISEFEDHGNRNHPK